MCCTECNWVRHKVIHSHYITVCKATCFLRVDTPCPIPSVIMVQHCSRKICVPIMGTLLRKINQHSDTDRWYNCAQELHEASVLWLLLSHKKCYDTDFQAYSCCLLIPFSLGHQFGIDECQLFHLQFLPFSLSFLQQHTSLTFVLPSSFTTIIK